MAKSNATQRLTLDLTPADASEVDRLMRQHGFATKHELFRHALAVLGVVGDEIQRGHELTCGGVTIVFPMLQREKESGR